VAKDSNAIVPVVSFKELARKYDQNVRTEWQLIYGQWLEEAARYCGEWIRRKGKRGCLYALVGCFFIYVISSKVIVRDRITGVNLMAQLAAVSKVFWPLDVAHATSRIVPCSSLMGLSAHALLDISLDGKPEFEKFWDETKTGVAHSVCLYLPF
jgi:hypothetical protein